MLFRRDLGLNQRLGLSRNKVAVPEGVAGTPPFWRPGCDWFDIQFDYWDKRRQVCFYLVSLINFFKGILGYLTPKAECSRQATGAELHH